MYKALLLEIKFRVELGGENQFLEDDGQYGGGGIKDIEFVCMVMEVVMTAVGDTLIVGVNVLGSVDEYDIVSIVFGFCWWVLCLAY